LTTSGLPQITVKEPETNQSVENIYMLYIETETKGEGLLPSPI